MKQVVFLRKAYQAIISDSTQYLDVETGGVLLGHKADDCWYVLETILAGDDALRKSNSFCYDNVYMEEQANRTAALYKNPLQLLGVWHKHPATDFSFSREDHKMHDKFLDTCASTILSGLSCVNEQRDAVLKIFIVERDTCFECNYYVDDMMIPPMYVEGSYPTN